MLCVLYVESECWVMRVFPVCILPAGWQQCKLLPGVPTWRGKAGAMRL